MTKLTAATFTIALAAALAAFATAQVAPSSARSSQGYGPGRTSRRGASPLALATAEAVGRARMAASKGDVAEAEALYREAIALNPDAPTARFDLAELLDRAGRTREAYAQYGIALRGNPRSWSSQQEDGRILARYGDLATRFGDADEAARAYAKAARDGDQDDVGAPRTAPRSPSLASLRAAAHAAAAVRLRNVGRNEEAEREIRIAAAADPSYWVPHFRLAQWLGAERGAERRAEAAREAALAQKLAPSAKHRAMVMRLDAGKRP